jgi:hypothetical protein
MVASFTAGRSNVLETDLANILKRSNGKKMDNEYTCISLSGLIHR